MKENTPSLTMIIVSFGRLMKKLTRNTFVEFLNDYRIGSATRLLIETNDSIAEIAFKCGFNNLANFNCILKKPKGLIPSLFKLNFMVVKKIYLSVN